MELIISIVQQIYKLFFHFSNRFLENINEIVKSSVWSVLRSDPHIIGKQFTLHKFQFN